jgi:hypothetical protein
MGLFRKRRKGGAIMVAGRNHEKRGKWEWGSLEVAEIGRVVAEGIQNLRSRAG